MTAGLHRGIPCLPLALRHIVPNLFPLLPPPAATGASLLGLYIAHLPPQFEEGHREIVRSTG